VAYRMYLAQYRSRYLTSVVVESMSPAADQLGRLGPAIYGDTHDLISELTHEVSVSRDPSLASSDRGNKMGKYLCVSGPWSLHWHAVCAANLVNAGDHPVNPALVLLLETGFRLAILI
jgi:hypothetical protein